MSRHTDRIHVFELTFQTNFQGEKDMKALLQEYLDENLKEKDNRKYIEEEFSGLLDKLPEIDPVIEKYAENWTLERLDKVALAVLRLSLYEILYTDIPNKVAANEAVEICKEYGEEKTPAFVNGILGKVLNRI